MINLIIFGTGATANLVLSGLNNNANILAFCDNNKNKWNKEYGGKKIVNPNDINLYKYDCILIASQFDSEIYDQLIKMGINKEKVFSFFKYNDYYSGANYIEFDLAMLKYYSKQVEVIATGISYVERAISSDVMKRKIHKFTRPSQDLYFDYNIMRYVLDEIELLQLKYCIIGLSYYSFQYDLSQSAMKEKVGIYYEAINKCHNYKLSEDYGINKKRYRDFFGKIFNMKKERTDLIDIDWNLNSKVKLHINEEEAKKQALMDGNKNYPETVKENIEILEKYLQLLIDNNIKPIVIICPVTKYYAKYFPQNIIDQFDNILKNIKKEFNFQFLNYFYSDLFSEEDFYDVSHLNETGSKKFTKLLEEDINW